MDLGSPRWGVEDLADYAEQAVALGFEAICANDHLVFSTPWLDGPTALAAVAAASGEARLVTTVANPVVRGPAALAKSLAAIDVLSGGRVVAGLGPGSLAPALLGFAVDVHHGAGRGVRHQVPGKRLPVDTQLHFAVAA